MAIKNDIGSLKLLPGDIWRRLQSPLFSVTFWTHLLISVVLAGGAGIWYTLIKIKLSGVWDMPAIAAALCTYFPAIVGAAFIEINAERQPYWRSFGVLIIGLFIFLFTMALMGVSDGSISWSVIGAIASLFFWWIANGEKDCFRDVHPDASTPSPDQEISGDTTGWKT